MIVRHLGDTSFNEIMECFLKAFENYFVKMPTDHEFYLQRWKAAKVRYDLSYGMFDDDRLVGFIIHAIDNRHGDYIAFNTGTGVLPEYRGQHIVKSMYEYAKPKLKAHGITKCALEVITENTIAIKAYKRIRFEICKRIECFQGTISAETFSALDIREQGYEAIDWTQMPNQESYSWDNHYKSLNQTGYKCYEVFNDSHLESYFVINSERAYLAQFEVLNQNEHAWSRLFYAISSISKSIKINNIDDRLTEKLKAVEHAGLSNSVNQFEMEMLLTN